MSPDDPRYYPEGSQPVPPAPATADERREAPPAVYHDARPGQVGPPTRRSGTGCVLSLLSAFFGALLGAALVAGIMLAVWGVPGEASDARDDGGNNGDVTITTDDDISFAEAVAEKAMPSVVFIGVEAESRDPFGGGTSTQVVGNGSGVIIREDGYILTNDHVVAEADALIVSIGVDELPAEVVGRDPSSDLAVIKVDRTGLPAIEIGSSEDLRVGQPVVAIGSPFGLDQSVTTGIVSALGRSSLAENAGASVTAYTSLIQTDAAINPGNSGGALTDAEGRLIGINTLIQTGGSEQSAGVGFAIPVDYAMQIAEDLIETGEAVHPFLGVSSMTISPSVAEQYDLPVDSGALVDSVSQGSPAEQAGIEPGDIIVRIGDTVIEGVEDVFAAVRSQQVGDQVEVEIIRGGESQTLQATLGSDADRQ